MEYLFLSSIYDSTHEGKSIKTFAKKYTNINIDQTLYQHFPFSATKPISGCNYKGLQIRKGSVQEIAKYLDNVVTRYQPIELCI